MTRRYDFTGMIRSDPRMVQGEVWVVQNGQIVQRLIDLPTAPSQAPSSASADSVASDAKRQDPR